MVKFPLASVMAVLPTWETDDHHHQKSTSYALTSAPGAGLPSAQTTRPVMVNSRHQIHHQRQKIGVIKIGVRVSDLSFSHCWGETLAVRVRRRKMSSSEA